MLVAGIDIGSITTEALLFDKEKGVVGYTILQTGADSKRTQRKRWKKYLHIRRKKVYPIYPTLLLPVVAEKELPLQNRLLQRLLV